MKSLGIDRIEIKREELVGRINARTIWGKPG
jgi:hypothetical protein